MLTCAGVCNSGGCEGKFQSYNGRCPSIPSPHLHIPTNIPLPSSMMTTASQKFWALPEMQLEVAKYLEEQDFRSIIVTSRFNHKRFLADAWRSISGIGHLMGILHDDLAVHAVGRGLPEVKVCRSAQRKFTC